MPAWGLCGAQAADAKERGPGGAAAAAAGSPASAEANASEGMSRVKLGS